jgi:hypothetical protein
MSAAEPGTTAQDFFARALEHIVKSSVPFMIGGAYAVREYTGIVRDTKDLDVFCTVDDYPRLLQVLAEAGYRTEITFPYWLAKAFQSDLFVDVIFNAPNAVCPVDAGCLAHAPRAQVLGYPVKLVPPEELIWCKSFVQERERFDGADVVHIIRKQGPMLDWQRVLARMDEYWEVLFAHLLTFRFVYPAERDTVPAWLMRELVARVEQQLAAPAPPEPLCRGLLISERQYQIDITTWGYQDVRAMLLQGRRG